MPRLSRAALFPLLTLGAGGGLIGAVAPWIPHRAAGLNVGGFALFETSKFIPAVRSGTFPLFREGFLLPLLTSALLLALAPAFVGNKPARAARWLCPTIAALVALAALPSYPMILTAHREPEYRWQLFLAVAAFVLTLLSPLGRRIPPRVLDILAAALTLGGSAPALVALARVRPLFSELYNEPLGIGWGVVVYSLSCAILLATALLPKTSDVNAPMRPTLPETPLHRESPAAFHGSRR